MLPECALRAQVHEYIQPSNRVGVKYVLVFKYADFGYLYFTFSRSPHLSLYLMYFWLNTCQIQQLVFGVFNVPEYVYFSIVHIGKCIPT